MPLMWATFATPAVEDVGFESAELTEKSRADVATKAVNVESFIIREGIRVEGSNCDVTVTM